ncbi:MAG: amidase [Actinobacteria bacterium]|nr:amidase [Actinomycetota bacterium]
MTNLPIDPLQSGLVDFGKRLRSGHISARAVTKAYLARIENLNPKLDAFSHVEVDQSLKAAEAVDLMLSLGIDLGPLMGVPVAVKDLFAVAGMPAKAGSNIELADCIGSEGGFVHRLRNAGCVILGKTRTVEFAAGAQNLIHPTPWNPCDMETHRTPGGSSHGSAVAVASGLCGFAIGSDTGGSVRQPAALCGVVGLKPSQGIWPMDGVFPLCPFLDTVGLVTSSVSDMAVAYTALTGCTVKESYEVAGLRLGIPGPDCMESMDADVAERYELSLKLLEAAGARLVSLSWPTKTEQQEIKAIYSGMVPSDLLATLGRERFQDNYHQIDPVAIKRLEGACDLRATEYIRLKRLQERLSSLADDRMQDLDGIIGPTVPHTPLPVSEVCVNVSNASAFVARSLSYTRAANIYGMCAITIPISTPPGMPVGLQIACSKNNEAKMLSMANVISHVVSA